MVLDGENDLGLVTELKREVKAVYIKELKEVRG